MKKLSFLIVPILLSFIFIMTSAAPVNGDKETERLHSASNVLKAFGAMKEGIPHKLIANYEGVVIIPKTINAGLVVGARRGKGVAIVKLPDGKWSDPVFVTLTGGSIGAQIGVQSVDLILVFKHKGALARVKNGDVTIGGDLAASAGPVGRAASASTDYKFEAEVYSYSRSRGLFAGITINGSSLAIDKDANHDYYGEGTSASDIFETTRSNTVAVKHLKETLASL
jgi:lipid-binding SYLF domain-containing protein